MSALSAFQNSGVLVVGEMNVWVRVKVASRPGMFRATSVLSFGNVAVATGRVDADGEDLKR